jgi:alpha-galactosidase
MVQNEAVVNAGDEEIEKEAPELKLKFNSMLRENLRHIFIRTVDNEYYVRTLVYRNNFYREINPESVPLFSFSLPDDAPVYIEGYQMLSHIGGTASAPVQLGRMNEFTDLKICSLSAGEVCGFNYLLTCIDDEWYLLGALTCMSTFLSFHLKNSRVDVVWEMSGVGIMPRSEYEGEKICLLSSESRSEVLNRYGSLIARFHKPRLTVPKTGWCSWYAYYDMVTEEEIYKNLDLMTGSWSELEYLQIDDGYQTHMGDWMTPSDRFTGGLEGICSRAASAGRKVGIWVAPFIASGESALFREHPDWMIRGAKHHPLVAGDKTYGGWRDLPWYLLDFTIPEVRDYIHKVFSYFHGTLGIDYFKLDALFWGAIPGLRYRNPGITVCQHFRTAMDVIRDAVGDESYILGCNAPLWPSLGLFEGQRVTDDIERRHARISEQSVQAQARSWMSGVLWLNDVDCMVSTGIIPEDAEIMQKMLLESKGPLIIGDPLDKAHKELHDLVKKWRSATEVSK